MNPMRSRLPRPFKEAKKNRFVIFALHDLPRSLHLRSAYHSRITLMEAERTVDILKIPATPGDEIQPPPRGRPTAPATIEPLSELGGRQILSVVCPLGRQPCDSRYHRAILALEPSMENAPAAAVASRGVRQRPG